MWFVGGGRGEEDSPNEGQKYVARKKERVRRHCREWPVAVSRVRKREEGENSYVRFYER